MIKHSFKLELPTAIYSKDSRGFDFSIRKPVHRILRPLKAQERGFSKKCITNDVNQNEAFVVGPLRESLSRFIYSKRDSRMVVSFLWRKIKENE